MPLRTVRATRYVVPLREGGSLPAIVEADDDGTYVLKFRGAGQGPKALIAELVAGEIARALGLPMPEIVMVELDASLAQTEADPELQDLIRASVGLNLALEYLPGSIMFDPIVEEVSADLASSVVWFDAFISNVDRTARNTNMLIWHRKLWLIDHGAALYFHHSHENYEKLSRAPFPMIKDHVLLPLASGLSQADERIAQHLKTEVLSDIVGSIPDLWLDEPAPAWDFSQQKAAYLDYFLRRLETPRSFLEEAIRARSLIV